MTQVEVEVKSLLGSEEKAKSLILKLGEKGFDISKIKKASQLNHYFKIKDLDLFKIRASELVSDGKKESLTKILSEGQNFSVRTRDADGKVIFVIKASLDNQTSSNGVTRLEFEEEVKMSLEDLDNFLLNSGLEYQAKWSREREEYSDGNVNICIDKNAGYGYLAEFERVIQVGEDSKKVKEEILKMMNEFGVDELDQERLARMFAYYNANWADYYGTDKIFNIE